MSDIYFEMRIPSQLYQMMEVRAERLGLNLEEYWLAIAVNEVKGELEPPLFKNSL